MSTSNALKALLTTECGVRLDEISEKIEELNKALEPLGMFVHWEDDGSMRYNMEVHLLPKWKNGKDFEQRVTSMNIKVDFFKHHKEDELN